MARAYRSSGAADYIRADPVIAVAVAPPLTISIWCRPASVGAGRHNFAIHGTTSNRFVLTQSGTSPYPLLAVSRAAGVDSTSSVGSHAAGTWAHDVGVFTSTTSRTAWQNNVQGAENTASSSPSGLTGTRVGDSGAGNNASSASADIHDATVWAAALDAESIAHLAGGGCPLEVYPDDLALFVIEVRDGYSYDIVGQRYFLRVGDAPALSAPPNLRRPNGRRIPARLWARARSADPARFGGRRVWVPVGAAGITGSGSGTEADDTLIAAGQVAVTGGGAATEAADTVAGAGVVTVSGAGAIAEAEDSVAGAGAVSVTGQGAATEAADTAAGVGIVAVTGAGAVTEAADTLDGAATAATPLPSARLTVALLRPRRTFAAVTARRTAAVVTSRRTAQLASARRTVARVTPRRAYEVLAA